MSSFGSNDHSSWWVLCFSVFNCRCCGLCTFVCIVIICLLKPWRFKKKYLRKLRFHMCDIPLTYFKCYSVIVENGCYRNYITAHLFFFSSNLRRVFLRDLNRLSDSFFLCLILLTIRK